MGWVEKTARMPSWCLRRGRRWRARHSPEILALAPSGVTVSSLNRLSSPLIFSPSPRPSPPPLHLGLSLHRIRSLQQPSLQQRRAMDQFHDRQHVRLRNRVRGTYLHADADGVGVSLSRSRASMNVAWAVHLYHDEDDGAQYLLLHNAAYGRYLAATDDSAPVHLCGFHVAQRSYDQPPQMAAIRWQAVAWTPGPGDDILLRHVGAHARWRYLRANGKHLRWIKRVTVDNCIYITNMMQWVVEPIPPRDEGMPALPPPIRDRLPTDLSVAILGRAEAAWRSIRYVRAADDGSYPADAQHWVGLLHFRGRSVRGLREQLANHLRDQFGVFDFIMCVRAGREGRMTPLVVNLPRHGTIEIVVITDGTPGSAELIHPDVDAV